MTEDEERAQFILLWLKKADEALESARLELDAGHPTFAINRIYYACFYAVTALLLTEGKQFSRHAGVRAEFHRSFVKTGRLHKEWGRLYDDLFADRQEGDYLPGTSFDPDDVASRLQLAREFLRLVRELIDSA